MKETITRGNVIINNIKIGDIHYEFDYGLGIKCQVTTQPVLNDAGYWEWVSKNLTSGRDIAYSVADINSENGKYNSQFGLKLYDYEAYKVNTYI